MTIKWHGFVLAAFVAATCIAGFGQAPPQGRGDGGGGGAAAGGGDGQRGGGRGGGQRGGAASNLPVPRGPDGHPRLSTEPGQKGLWHGGFAVSGTNIPYQPWARAVAEVRQREKLEPHSRCKPSGAVRQFQTPYGVDFVELPEQKVVYIVDVGGPHTFRTIYMDGRQHPKDLVPSYYGHSIGSWDGDTFVIDTVGYNEKFWLDRGDTPNTGFVHTEQLRTIERLTRTSYNTIQYELTIDDPGAYTATWKTNNYNITLQSSEELFEYICQDNNYGSELMVGTMGTIDRTTPIVP